MIPLEELKNCLLDELKWKDVGSPRQQVLYMFLDEIPNVSDAQQLVFRIETKLKEQMRVVETVREKVLASFLWDIWGYYPFERIEGPYDELEVARKRMLQLNEQMKRPHILVIVDSEQEKRYKQSVFQS